MVGTPPLAVVNEDGDHVAAHASATRHSGWHTGQQRYKHSAKAQRDKLPKSTHEQLPCHRPQTARDRQSTAAAADTKGSPRSEGMAPMAPVPRARRPPPDVPVYDVNDSRPASAAPSEHFADPPDVTISTGVGMRGELSFPKLLRVEGHFAGTLTCGGDVVIAPGGTLEADVDNANGYLLVEGTVLGNVNARGCRSRRRGASSGTSRAILL